MDQAVASAVVVAAPRVAILMPCYNGIKYLDAAIQSCLDQTASDFELICVDDKSTDSTLELLHSWAERDARIKVVPHAVNRGQGVGFQTALDASTAPLVTRLACDDVFFSEALAAMLSAMEAHPEAGMTYCDMEQIDSDGSFLGRMVTEEPARALLPNNRVGICVMWRREVHGKTGPFTPNSIAEDYDLWLRISIFYPMVKAKGGPQLGYRLHQAQSSTSAHRITASGKRAHLHYHKVRASLAPWSLYRRYRVLRSYVACKLFERQHPGLPAIEPLAFVRLR